MTAPPSPVFAFEEFRVDAGRRLLTRGDGEPIPLTPKVFDTLVVLVQSGGRALTKDELMRAVWPDSVVEENNLTQNMSILRRVFGEKPGERRFIATVAGHGYRFVPDVRALPDPAQEVERAPVERIAEPTAEPVGHRGRSRVVAVVVAVALVAAAIGTYAWRRTRAPAAAPPIRSLAVLPFKPLVAERRDAVVELGMADTLISKMSGDERIVVRPLSAVRRYDSVDQDALAAGRALAVDSVLDGTMQTMDNRIRISVRLLRTTDGRQIWAAQFDENASDIFVVQDSIAEKLAAALAIRLRDGSRKHGTDNIEAYEAYMKGLYHVSKLDPSSMAAAISGFQHAIALDPSYVQAHTGLAAVYRVYAISGERPATEMFPMAKKASERAIALDAGSADAHLSLGQDRFWYDWDWSGAEKEWRRAVQLDPNNALARVNLALLLSNTGRHPEALAEARRARELDPLALGIGAIEGQCLVHAGRIDEALDRLKKTSELEPRFWMSHSFAASAYIEKGQFEAAIAADRRERDLTGMNTIPFGAYALAKSGNEAAARAVLDELVQRSKVRHVSPYNIALIHNALGDTNETLAWLERGYVERDPKMTFLKVEPKWNNLRTDARFAGLIRRMHLE